MLVTFAVGNPGIVFSAEFASFDDLRTRDKEAFQEIVIKELNKYIRSGLLQIKLSFDIV